MMQFLYFSAFLYLVREGEIWRIFEFNFQNIADGEHGLIYTETAITIEFPIILTLHINLFITLVYYITSMRGCIPQNKQ